MLPDGDTIAAIATAAGVGGVGIIRISGPRAIELAAAALQIEPAALTRTVRLGEVHDLAGTPVDQVLAFAMRAPHSFTGEDVAELQGHGGIANVNRLLAAIVDRGARIAEPGEFTRRAVTNGKLDLLRAESLLSVIHAGSERGLRLAQANLAGKLGVEIASIERSALALLAEVEGRIDFPDEDLGPIADPWVASETESLRTACASLADGFRHAKAVTEGITVALVGPVNVGKSSLLNALVGTERALVADAPGTTRDWLEVRDSWDGVTVTLVDTAGLRSTDDPIEKRGIELGESRVASADVVLVVDDQDRPRDDRYGARAIHVRSKADVAPRPAPPDVMATSARTGAGLAELRARVLEVAGVADREGAEQPFVTTARQQALAAAARTAFAAAGEILVSRQPPEILAVELRAAAQALAQLRGLEVGDRVLDEVFARFCIGK